MRTEGNLNEKAGDLWRDRWCFSCHGLRRFVRDEYLLWRCACGRLASTGVQKDLDSAEHERLERV